MHEIKTRNVRSDFHTFDRSADLAAKMRRSVFRAEDSVREIVDDGHSTPDEYAQSRSEYTLEDVAYGAKNTGRKMYGGGKKLARQINKNRQTAKTVGKQTFKKAERGAKTVERTSHTALKTAEQTARAAERTAKASAQAAKRSAQAAKKAAEIATKTTKAAVKATISAIKAIVAAVKSLACAIAAGGWVAVVIIIVIVMVALIVGSCFGIFYSAGDTDGLTMQRAVSDIQAEYQARIDEVKDSVSHDILEVRGIRARWQEVLAVYAVKTATDPDSAQEVATMDEEKYDILEGIFWDMHAISKSVAEKSVTEYVETVDEDGNIVAEETKTAKTVLCISVAHKNAEEMKDEYGFSATQRAQLDELLREDKAKLWGNVLYGFDNDGMVGIAVSQLGNCDGQPYWSWYGFSSRVDWCACFVSWCANECGYIGSGVIPKFALCQHGVNWFSERGQWQDRTYVPQAGDIVFFDWDNRGGSGPQDGVADHMGIVEKVTDGKIYTIEGNSGDQCRERVYAVGYYELLGFGVPCA